MRIIKQSTYETCLPCSLLMITGKNKKYEIEIWKHGWKFNYLIGQLNFVSKKFKTKFKAFIENRYYFGQLQKQKNQKISLVNQKVNFNLLRKLLKHGKVIIYLDLFFLFKVIHAPHFIVANKIIGNNIEIADPADGKVKLISLETLNKAIISLRNHMKYSPVLVVLNQ